MVINFNSLPCLYWSIKTKIEYIQRRIIVYSIMYYELNDSCISDKDFDELSKQLVELKKANPEEYKKTKYYYVLNDFDGSTGFYIPDKLNEQDKEHLTNISRYVLKLYHNEG